jgi:hypothetical protein
MQQSRREESARSFENESSSHQLGGSNGRIESGEQLLVGVIGKRDNDLPTMT